MATIIRLADVTKYYGSKLIFADINAETGKNEIIGLVGRNGIGKSTLANIISGTDQDYTGNLAK